MGAAAPHGVAGGSGASGSSGSAAGVDCGRMVCVGLYAALQVCGCHCSRACRYACIPVCAPHWTYAYPCAASRLQQAGGGLVATFVLYVASLALSVGVLWRVRFRMRSVPFMLARAWAANSHVGCMPFRLAAPLLYAAVVATCWSPVVMSVALGLHLSQVRWGVLCPSRARRASWRLVSLGAMRVKRTAQIVSSGTPEGRLQVTIAVSFLLCCVMLFFYGLAHWRFHAWRLDLITIGAFGAAAVLYCALIVWNYLVAAAINTGQNVFGISAVFMTLNMLPVTYLSYVTADTAVDVDLPSFLKGDRAHDPTAVVLRVSQAPGGRDVRVSGDYVEATERGVGAVSRGGRLYNLIRSVYECRIERRSIGGGDAPPVCFWVLMAAADGELPERMLYAQRSDDDIPPGGQWHPVSESLAMTLEEDQEEGHPYYKAPLTRYRADGAAGADARSKLEGTGSSAAAEGPGSSAAAEGAGSADCISVSLESKALYDLEARALEAHRAAASSRKLRIALACVRAIRICIYWMGRRSKYAIPYASRSQV